MNSNQSGSVTKANRETRSIRTLFTGRSSNRTRQNNSVGTKPVAIYFGLNPPADFVANTLRYKPSGGARHEDRWISLWSCGFIVLRTALILRLVLSCGFFFPCPLLRKLSIAKTAAVLLNEREIELFATISLLDVTSHSSRSSLLYTRCWSLHHEPLSSIRTAKSRCDHSSISQSNTHNAEEGSPIQLPWSESGLLLGSFCSE